MGEHHNVHMEKQMEELVEEFLERDLVAAETKERAERLYAKGSTAEALEVLLEDRKRIETDASPSYTAN